MSAPTTAPGVPDDVALARAAWSRLAEPGDEVAGALLAALGPVEALDWVRGASRAPLLPALPGSVGALGPSVARRLGAGVARWSPRLERLDPSADVAALRRSGGRLVTPEGDEWPSGLADLGPAAPACLWVRGTGDVGALARRSAAVIGARACTAYGEHVAGEIAAGVGERGFAVVSGGAYGIDAVAHRGALAVEAATVCVVAGGVDRPYPAGNARLLAAVADRGGVVVAEVPPGCVPTKSRFLQRNRLIAALAGATVVVEAAWRSGALSTARHAAQLLRPVGAVPGPVTSAASAGCHRLLREGAAVCVTDAAEVAELAGGPGEAAGGPPDEVRPGDGLDEVATRALDALPVRRGAGEESLARVAGLGVADVRSALGVLELRGLAERTADGWRRRT